MLKDKRLQIRDFSGFTLIEVVVYLALFAILFGGSVLAVYNIVEASGRNQARAVVEEEGEFLLAKISWVLSGAKTVISPTLDVSAPTQSPILTVNEYDGSVIGLSTVGTDLQLQKGSTNTILNASGVWVSGLMFTHVGSAGSGVNPEYIKIKFTLSAKTSNGTDVSENFSTVTYLRK